MFFRKNRAGLMAVMFALSLIVGEASGFSAADLNGIWPWSACFTLFVACVFRGWEIPAARYVFAFMAGITLAWCTESSRRLLESHAMRPDRRGLPPEYTLRIGSDPIIRQSVNGKTRRLSFDSKIGDMPVKVMVRLDGEIAHPQRDEIWRCRGWLSLKKDSPHRYSRRTLWVMDGGSLKRESGKGSCRAGIWYPEASKRLAERAETGLGWCPEIAALNKAMLLGMRSEMPREKRRTFADAGTVHVFAISGLHVMMVAAAMNSLLLCFRIKPAIRCMILLPALSSYVMLSGAKPSAVRAATMAAVLMTAAVSGRKADSLASWAAAAVLTYALSPSSVFDTGCLLSFTVMLGLLLWIKWSSQFAPPTEGWLKMAAFEKKFGDAKAFRILRNLCKCTNWFLGALGISFATWIAGAPVVATSFGKISPAGILANVFVVPLACVSVVLGAVGIASSFLSDLLAAFFNNLSAFSTIAMDRISQWAATIPGGTFDSLPWRWYDCAMWYMAWLALFTLLSRHLRKRESIPLYEWQ